MSLTHHTDNVCSEESPSALSACPHRLSAVRYPSPASSATDYDAGSLDRSSQQQALRGAHTTPSAFPSTATSPDAAHNPSFRSRAPTRSRAAHDAHPINDSGKVSSAKYPKSSLLFFRRIILSNEIFSDAPEFQIHTLK